MTPEQPTAAGPALREGLITVTGGQVWYCVLGAGQPGVPLLVLHGGPGAPHDYLEPLAALAGERPVVFYDQLGCGNSERPSDPALWTLERFVEELAQVRAFLGLTRLHILGQSWGAMLAVDYMLGQKPPGVLSLVLAGPCLSAPRFVADQRRHLEAMPEETRRVILEKEAAADYDSPEYQEAMMAFYRRHLCRLDPWPDCMDRTLDKMGLEVYHHMWGPSEFTMTGTLRDYDRVGRLKELALPVLYTCGEHDEATPATTALYHQATPGSRLKVLAGASHQHHLEAPEEFISIVAQFLREAEGRP
ncbi:MAG: proline iminopeptidase-family hydrolase [Desulfarculus sp.]|nr:proline iminopeptidase-family hydrolase [Desulfarculus sp.]